MEKSIVSEMKAHELTYRWLERIKRYVRVEAVSDKPECYVEMATPKEVIEEHKGIWDLKACGAPWWKYPEVIFWLAETCEKVRSQGGCAFTVDADGKISDVVNDLTERLATEPVVDL